MMTTPAVPDTGDERPEANIDPSAPERRRIKLTPASGIKIRPVQWLWEGRVALGTLALVAGREGLGKSTWAYGLTADITRGRLPGCYAGEPKAVIVAATEDSWEHTIVPRLMAAGADLDLVYRVEVVTSEGTAGYLSLPKDNVELEAAVTEVSAALILLDPLLSRLDASLDSHKDAEVRVALEPLVAIADRAGAAIGALIHVNKSTSTDPSSTIMGSRAFAAVARSILIFARDPEDDEAVLVGLEKNNLGRADLPTLRLRIEGVHVADTAEGPVWSSRTVLIGETDVKIRDVMADNALAPDDRTAADEAADWLSDYLEAAGGSAESSQVKAAGKSAGRSLSTLNRARRKLRATAESQGFPRRTWWCLRQSIQPVGESESTGITESTESTDGPSGASGFSHVSRSIPPARANQLGEFTCSRCAKPIAAYDAFGREVCEEHAEVAQWTA